MRWESAQTAVSTDTPATVTTLLGVTYDPDLTTIAAAWTVPAEGPTHSALEVRSSGGVLLRRVVQTVEVPENENSLVCTGLTAGTGYQCRVLLDDTTAFTAL